MGRIREFAKSTGLFVWGVLSKFYLWAPALLLDPFDWYERIRPWLPAWAPQEVVVPTWLGLVAFIVLVAIAAIKTYHDLRIENLQLLPDEDLVTYDEARGEILIHRGHTSTIKRTITLPYGEKPINLGK